MGLIFPRIPFILPGKSKHKGSAGQSGMQHFHAETRPLQAGRRLLRALLGQRGPISKMNSESRLLLRIRREKKKKNNARPKRLQTSSLLEKNRRKIKYSGDITGTACWLCEVIKQFLLFFFFSFPSGFFFPVNKIGSSKSES